MHLTADTVKHLQLKGAYPLCFLRSKQELFTLLRADVWLLVSSFIIAQQTPVFIHCIINTAK